jgi:hypothetical protein
MKRWSLVLATVAVFFVGDRLGAMLLERVTMSSPQRYSRLYSGRLAGDLLCVGNSRGVSLLDAELVEKATGQRLVNISGNGLSAQMVKALVEDYLDHQQPPKVIVIEASCVTTATGPGVVSDFKPFWSRSPRLSSLAEKYATTVATATQVTWLYRFNSELFLRSMYFLVRNKSDQFGLLSGQIPQALVREVEQMKPFNLELVPDELQALHDLIGDLRKRGVVVRLVYAPYLPQYAEKMSNLDDSLKKISESANLETIDLTRALTNDDLFVDRVHMNATGTGTLTQKLLDQNVF